MALVEWTLRAGTTCNVCGPLVDAPAENHDRAIYSLEHLRDVHGGVDLDEAIEKVRAHKASSALNEPGEVPDGAR